jgi:hypothetical protein
MTSSEADVQAKLEPPGAGLPRLELLASRVMFKVVMPFVTRAGANRWIRTEADRILELARPLSAEDATKRVLIPRLAGLEDSSRFWSVCMALDHLVIVTTAVGRVIESLAQGVVPTRTASTAEVKPNPAADVGVTERFEASLRDYFTRVDAIANLKTKEKYRHPWFGPLDALNWHRLTALHHRIHRRQVERIIALGREA